MSKSLETIDEESDENELSVFDESDPRSVINLIPPRLKEIFKAAVLTKPDFLGLPEHKLQKELKPDELSDKMRLSFWTEYVRAQDSGQNMRVSNIYNKLTSKEYFYHYFLINPDNILWMLCRPEDYFLSLEAMLNESKKNLYKILNMELFTSAGVLNDRAAGIFLKAFEMIQNRVKGGVVAKVESRNLHKIVDDSTDTLKKELEALRLKQGGARDVGES